MDVAGRLGIPAGVAVVREDHVRKWGAIQRSVVHDALAQGRVVVDASWGGDR